MNLNELKRKSINELMDIANNMGIENTGREHKHKLIFSILEKLGDGGHRE